MSDSRIDTATGQSSSGAEANLHTHYECDTNDADEQALKYSVSHIIHLFVPTSVCMAFVILTMTLVGYYSHNDGVYLYVDVISESLHSLLLKNSGFILHSRVKRTAIARCSSCPLEMR